VRAFALRVAISSLLAAALLATLPASAQGAKPTVFPSPPQPATAQHTAYIVTTNKKGQVVTAKSEQNDRDKAFDLMTYGNALQMFIRTADGGAIPGRYRVTYDYSPETKSVKRNVALVAADGASADAPSAVDRMRADEQRSAERAKQARKAKSSPAPAR
jgi:hypothetical protein